MQATGQKSSQRLAPLLRRVLIVDPSPVAARMVAGLVRSLGAGELLLEADERCALELARMADPTLIFVEHTGPRLDGEAFTCRLRRSDFACRRAPVIMVASDATAAAIKGARDSGVHEFLRKPFTAADLIRRVEAVAAKPRDWIEATNYFGPDRRRFNSAEFNGKPKRRSDRKPFETVAIELDRSANILKSAVSRFDADPAEARRVIAEQASFLKTAIVDAVATPRTAVAVAMLELAVGRDDATKAALVGLVDDVLDLFETSARAA